MKPRNLVQTHIQRIRDSLYDTFLPSISFNIKIILHTIYPRQPEHTKRLLRLELGE